MKCDYACGSEEHLIARRQFIGGVATGAGAVLGGLGAFATPEAVAKMTKDQKRVIVVLKAQDGPEQFRAVRSPRHQLTHRKGVQNLLDHQGREYGLDGIGDGVA